MYRCLLFTVYNDVVCMYCELKGSIFAFSSRSPQESLFLEFVMILIFFFISEYCKAGCAPKNYTVSYNGMYVRKIYHSLSLMGQYRFNL